MKELVDKIPTPFSVISCVDCTDNEAQAAAQRNALKLTSKLMHIAVLDHAAVSVRTYRFVDYGHEFTQISSPEALLLKVEAEVEIDQALYGEGNFQYVSKEDGIPFKSYPDEDLSRYTGVNPATTD